MLDGCGSVTLDNWGEWQAPNTPIASSDCQGIENVTFTYVGVAPTEYAESNIVPSDVGTYKVIAHFPATDIYNEYFAENEFEIISSASANVDLSNNAISIYPNPNKGQFTIDLSAIKGAKKYQIIDTKGAVVYENVVTNIYQQVNINQVAGKYAVRVFTDTMIYIKNIVIQ